MTNLTVRLFARFRELAGRSAIDLSVPSPSTVGDLRRTLMRLWPDAEGLLAVSAIAINDDYAADDRVVEVDDDLALIPPVSGGAGTTPLLPVQARQKQSSAATKVATT